MDSHDGAASTPDAKTELVERIARQFSDSGQRAAVWRALDLVVETDAYLNLGYSRWYQPHIIGSPQRRLVDRIGRDLATLLPETASMHLLDLGCGRGGPAVRLAHTRGLRVTGIDLVTHNVHLARANADEAGVEASFLVGEATRLPIRSGVMDAVTAIDSPVYVADTPGLYQAVFDVLRPGGPVVVTDLVTTAGLDSNAISAVDEFATTWDMPRLSTRAAVQSAVEAAGFEAVEVEDITNHSVGRFRKWVRLFLFVATSRLAPAFRRFLAARGIDLDAVVDTVRTTESALPYLRHVVIRARHPG